MSEHLTSQNEAPRATPRNVANVLMGRKVVETAEIALPKAGDVIIRDGQELMYVPDLRWTKRVKDGKLVDVQVPYTYQQYYSHSFEDPVTHRWEPAPGHDGKFRLFDDAAALRMHGRIFTQDELEDLPNNLPDEDALFLESINGGRAAEYKEFYGQQNT